MSLGFFADPGLTQPLFSVQAMQANDGTSAAVDRVIYLGSPTAGKLYRAAGDPGVEAIVVSLQDSAPGNGAETGHVALAGTQAGLTGATPGEALSLGVQLLSGVGNAAPIFLRVKTPALTSATYGGLTLTVNALVEVAL